MTLARLLLTRLGRYRVLIAAVVLFQCAQTVATLMLPSLNADIIDKGVLTRNTGYIWRLGGVMLILAALQIIVAVAATYFGSKTAMSFGRDLRRSLFHQITDFSSQEVARFGAPSLITRITNDVQQVQVLVVMTFTLLVGAPIMLIGGVIMAVRQDGPLSLILVVSIPAMLIGIGMVIVQMVPQFQAMQGRLDRVNQVLREQITGIRVVRAFVREPEETARFATANEELTANSLRAGRLMGLMFPIVMLVLNGSSAAALWFGGNRVGAGHLKVGALIAFLSYLVQILMSVMMATFVAMMWPRAAVCAERIADVLSTESTIRRPLDPVTDLPLRGSVEFRDVGFHYPGAEAPVLAGISFRAGPGQTTAVIGSTGAGKTTLVNLIPRLFDVTSGEVLVDGVDVRSIDLDLLWSRVALVPQKPYLFSGTVATNLRYADPDATDDELWAALEVAQARDFVAAMPGGLDAPIAQGGSNVSGGQRQRLAIARALVRKPEIYLFDDSFSALDLATDARLRAALVPVTAQATVLIVAQRVSTIAGADQILVVEDGTTVGLGSHDELLAGCETYAEIVESQRGAGALR